jgi:predicted nucleic acid-binding protein
VIILDTDALGHIQKKDPVGVLIVGGLDASPDRDIRITAVTAYEMLGGASALIDRRKKEHRDLIPAFYLLQDLIEYLGNWRGLILPYETTADRIYKGLAARLRQELKDDARIAAIALVGHLARPTAKPLCHYCLLDHDLRPISPIWNGHGQAK